MPLPLPPMDGADNFMVTQSEDGPKDQCHGFESKIVTLYARGMTLREIHAHLLKTYRTEIAASQIAAVVDASTTEVTTWLARPLESVYPIVYLDCIRLQVRVGPSSVKTVYLAIGVSMSGKRDVLGLWLAQDDRAKFWKQVLADLRERGVQDILIARIDDIKDFPEAMEAAYPETTVKLCVTDLVRRSLNYVPRNGQKAVAADLRGIYQATTASEAERGLSEFEARWDKDYVEIGQSWRQNWSRIGPFFDYPPEVRKMLHTITGVEAVDVSFRRLIANRSTFPSDEELLKVLGMVLCRVSLKWAMINRGQAALAWFSRHYRERISAN